LDVTAPDGGVLVLRDTYYPGWTATVNGAPIDLLRTDVLYRAVALPSGAATPHRVEMTFRSLPFERAVPISLVSFALMALLALWRRK
jgi:uncharacterized membrane protein YfhO